MEFRTRPPGSGGDSSDSGSSGDSDVVDQLLQQTKKQLAKDPQKRVQLATTLQENYGIDPQITSLFVPGLEDDIREMQEVQEEATNTQQPAMEQPKNDSSVNQNVPNQMETKEMSQEPPLTDEDLKELVTDLKDVLGPETTLEELEEIINNNTGQVNNLIQMYL